MTLSTAAFAMDRVVEEFGVPPTYPSITAAVAAAVDGDRIVIKNRAGNIPWIEDVTVNKSLDFVSFTNGTPFIVQGLYRIEPAEGRSVSIISMRNLVGNIENNNVVAPVQSTQVRIVDCQLEYGSIYFGTPPFRVDVMGCSLSNGGLLIQCGNVVGNDINGAIFPYGGLTVSSIETGSPIDTSWVVGNRVLSPAFAASALLVSGYSEVYHVRNNYVQHRYVGIQLDVGSLSGLTNTAWNNTIVAYSAGDATYGINVTSTPVESVWDIMNNVITTTISGNNQGIQYDPSSLGECNVRFNHLSSGLTDFFIGSFTSVENNVQDQPIALNTDGSLASAPGAVDGANPDPAFSDLDLSLGDAGAYGGSYSLVNYFPLHTGAARIGHVLFPFDVREGLTLNVQATAFDAQSSMDTIQAIGVQNAECFFDTDPGEGLATAMLAVDGIFDAGVEVIECGEIPPVNPGVRVLNIRAQDIQGGWGPVFRVVVNMDTTISSDVYVNNHVATHRVSLFPNPSESGRSVTLDLGVVERDVLLTLVDERGQLLYERKLTSAQRIDLSLHGLSIGVYALRVQCANRTEKRKLIVR